jgi:chorismate dehydratase
MGVKRSGLMNRIDLIEDYPSKIASMLLNDEIDVGLIPVAVIPLLKEHYIVTDFCIGTEGEVASVALFSDVPIEEIKKVVLDYQSRTSVRLAQILLKNHWKKTVVFEEATADFIDHIAGTTAAVVIGDRALQLTHHSKYIYDLGSAWKNYTGLPFVFAAWVANKQLDADFIDAFNRANGYGIKHLDEVLQENTFPDYDLRKYYTQNISYELTAQKREALQKFISYL